MSLFLGGLSAWEYLSLHDRGSKVWGSRACRCERDLRSSRPTRAEVEDALCHDLSGLTSPVSLLVGSRGARRILGGAVCRVWEGALPERAFLKAGRSRDLFVSTPEFAYIQMAFGCTSIRLIVRGFEACGAYWTTQRDMRGFSAREPLTTPEAIGRMLSSTGAARASRKVRRALQHVCPGAASPMESALVMLLCLPCSMGGYGFSHPSLNYRVAVPLKYGDRIPQGYFLCDLYWDEARLDVEYDSTMFHAGSSRELVRNSIRRDGLALLGVSVVTVTAGQVYDVDEFDRVARLIAKKLGHRVRTDHVSDWEWRRGELRKQILLGKR